MKRVISVFCVAVLCFVSFSGIPVSAADTVRSGGDDAAVTEPSNVTITVVMPEKVEEQNAQPPSADEIATGGLPVKVYPSDVTEVREAGHWEIIKTYELSEDENPEDIPRSSFERSGWVFTLTDILRKETAYAETRAYTETVTLNTDTKELEQILPLLEPTMEYTAEDGFVGVLTLDVSSITVETAGTKTSSYAMSVTREYPHLSSNDTSLVPKTVEDRGTTYTLAGVDWKAGNTVTVDYEVLPEYYTAVATYTATGYTTKVTGYTTTAVYTGDLAKLAQGKTVYTAYFLGEEMRTPLELVEPAPAPEAMPDEAEPIGSTDPADMPQDAAENNSGISAWLIILPCLTVLAGGAIYFVKRKVNHNAKNHNPAHIADGNGDNDSIGAGG